MVVAKDIDILDLCWKVSEQVFLLVSAVPQLRLDQLTLIGPARCITERDWPFLQEHGGVYHQAFAAVNPVP